MIEINTKMLKDLERRLGTYSSKAPLVLARALNRAAQNTKSNISKKTRETYTAKAKDIKDTIRISNANSYRLGAVVYSRGNLIALDKFKISPTQANPKKVPKKIKVSVKKGNVSEFMHAFIANIQGNKLFQRVGKARLPIKRLMGPAVPQMIDNAMIRKFVEKEAKTTFDKRLEHEIKRVLEGNK